MDSLIGANIKQRPLRTAVSVIGVALGVILVVLFAGLARGMIREAATRQASVDAEIRFLPGGNPSLQANPLMLPEAYADALINGVQPGPDDPDLTPIPPIPNIAAVTAVGEMIQSSGSGIGFETIDGIDYSSFIKTTQLRISRGRELGDGRKPGAEYEAIVDEYYVENTKDVLGNPVQVGSKITVLGNQFTVVGIYEPSVLARVKIPLHTLQELMGGAPNCTFINVKCVRPELTEQVQQSIKKYYPDKNVILTTDILALYSQGFGAVEIFLNVVIGLAVVISSLVILLAMYTTIIERTREIGILKSLGASKQFIVMIIEKEAALISAMGIVVGFAIATAAKFWIESHTRLRIDLQPKWLLIAALIGLLGGVIGAFYPALRAANLDPVEAISYD